MTKVVVISGPSGVGKTTVVSELRAVRDFHFSVSATTRAARPGEADGVDYHFLSVESFEALRRDGSLLEWAEYGGHLYGTLRSELDVAERAGLSILLDVEVHGAMQIKDVVPAATTIFVAPPDFESLEQRLRQRGDTDDAEARLEIARWQLEVSSQHFDHIVINDTVDAAVAEIDRILASP